MTAPTAPPPQRTHDSGLSLLRVVSAFAVIMLHAAAGIAGGIPSGFDRGWWLANGLDAAARFCVPVFLMISGALLLGYQQEDGPFIRRRLKRIVVPLLFWTIIYLLHNALKNLQYVADNPKEFLVGAWNALLNGVAYHLWYVYMLIGVCLFLPVLNAWVRQAPRRHIETFLLIAFLFSLNSQPWFDPLLPNIDGHYFWGYGSYFVLGYYLYKYPTVLQRRPWLPYVLYLLSVLITAYGTYHTSKSQGSFDGLFYEYRSPGVVLMSLSVFAIGLQFRNLKLPRWVLAADAASYGIYLVHILVMEYAWKIAIDVTTRGTLRILLHAFFTFLISFAAVWLLRRIRSLRNLTG